MNINQDNTKFNAIELIQEHLPNDFNCDWVETVNSTQSLVKPNSLLITEHQSSGVGRRGKPWITPHGRSICLSYRFELPIPTTQMSGYQMTSALAILSTILSFDAGAQVQLKWPNDLYHEGQKFAGILINLIPKQQQTEVIVGIGINWRLTPGQLTSVDQPVCNIPLLNLTSKRTLHRHEFIAELIQNIETYNQKFIQQGLSYFLPLWHKHDFLLNQTIKVTSEKQQITGQYHGINQHGELMMQHKDRIKTFSSGEVSVKTV